MDQQTAQAKKVYASIQEKRERNEAETGREVANRLRAINPLLFIEQVAILCLLYCAL